MGCEFDNIFGIKNSAALMIKQERELPFIWKAVSLLHSAEY